MTRDYTHYLVNLVNEDPDYVVDVLGLSSWELVKAFPKHVQAFIQDEYNVRPEDTREDLDEEECDDGSDPEEVWADEDEEEDI